MSHKKETDSHLDLQLLVVQPVRTSHKFFPCLNYSQAKGKAPVVPFLCSTLHILSVCTLLCLSHRLLPLMLTYVAVFSHHIIQNY